MTGAEADTLVYVSFILLCATILNIFVFIFDFFNIPTLISIPYNIPPTNWYAYYTVFPPRFFLLLGVITAITSRALYLLSLPLHIKYGYLFDSIFDLYQDRIIKLKQTIIQNPDTHWGEAQNYLLYLLIKCPKCSNYFPNHIIEVCPHCKQQ